jgi:hypothetical protein
MQPEQREGVDAPFLFSGRGERKREQYYNTALFFINTRKVISSSSLFSPPQGFFISVL